MIMQMLMHFLDCQVEIHRKEEPLVCQVRFTNSLPISAKDIKQETGRDPLLARVLSFVLNGWPKACVTEELRPYFNRKLELFAEQGCVLWDTRVVIPPIYRDRMLEELYETHQGICRTKAYARSYIWFQDLDSQIENFSRVVKAVNCLEISQHMLHCIPGSFQQEPGKENSY